MRAGRLLVGPLQNGMPLKKVRGHDGKVVARVTVFFQRIEKVAHAGAVALHMQDGIADDKRRKPGAAPIALSRDRGFFRSDHAAFARCLVLAAGCAYEQIAETGYPLDGVNATRCNHVFHRIVILQGAGLAKVFKVACARHIEGLRAFYATAQGHALLVKTDRSRMIAVRERIPVFLGGVVGLCFIVIVYERQCGVQTPIKRIILITI